MTADIAKLRALAAAHAWEGWYSQGYLRDFVDANAAAYIAAVDPQTILGLLDELERLRAVAEAARSYVRLHDTMNYPDTAAMYPAGLRDALVALDR